MDIEPQESIHRIIKSGRPLDTHETIERLTTLRNHYQEMVSYLYAHSNTKVYPINVTDLALPKVLEIITTTIQENM